MILDYRSLGEDGIVPDFLKSQGAFAENCMLMKGYQEIRPVTKEEWQKEPLFQHGATW